MFAQRVVILLVVSLTPPALTATAHAVDGRELDARQAYAAGRYQEAVELYSKLYAATLHPTYLRNIGRCYQNLEEPSTAIKSYQEYLRKGRVTAAERREVEGFIAEMEALKKRQAAATPSPMPTTSAPPTPASPTSVPPAASPSALAPPGPTPPPAPPSLSPPLVSTPSASAGVTERAGERNGASSPLYARWWFWTAVGVAAAAGGGAFLLTRHDHPAGGPSTDYGPYTPEWK